MELQVKFFMKNAMIKVQLFVYIKMKKDLFSVDMLLFLGVLREMDMF